MDGLDLAIYVIVISSNFTLWYKIGKIEQKVRELQKALKGLMHDGAAEGFPRH
jgi:hypothetical protein